MKIKDGVIVEHITKIGSVEFEIPNTNHSHLVTVETDGAGLGRYISVFEWNREQCVVGIPPAAARKLAKLLVKAADRADVERKVSKNMPSSGPQVESMKGQGPL